MWDHICPPPGDRVAKVTGQMAGKTEYSAINLMKDAGVDAERWNRMPDDATIQRTIEAIKARNIDVILTSTVQGALGAILNLLPERAEVMNGTSTTLNEIRYDFAQENPKEWRDYHDHHRRK